MTQFSKAINASSSSTGFSERWLHYAVMFGATIFLLPVPWLVVVIACCMAWYGLIGWIYRTSFGIWVGEKVMGVARKLGQIMLRDVRNSPYLISLFCVGIGTPLLFGLSFWYQTQVAEAFNWWAVLGYHVLTYGPYFVFFSQIATLIHKEGHEPKGLFKEPFTFLNKFYGHFLSLFYGHVPEGYPMGHMRIHHKYDNAPEDVTSTVYYDRTQPVRFMIYLFEFMLFWTGISVAAHHYKKGRKKEFRKMVSGMAVYFGLMAAVMTYNWQFGFAYLLLPHLSAIVFLAVINYTWHAFTDPKDPKNIYKNSITVLNGQYNVYNEDYHVEHHKRPQTHWEEYPINYAKHREEYAANRAIIFDDTQAFVIFFWILLGNYDEMAKHMVDLNDDMGHDDRIALLKERLRARAE